MNFNLEYQILERTEVKDSEAYEAINQFIEENQDIDGIYKIQIDEVLSHLRRKNVISEDE